MTEAIAEETEKGLSKRTNYELFSKPDRQTSDLFSIYNEFFSPDTLIFLRKTPKRFCHVTMSHMTQ